MRDILRVFGSIKLSLVLFLLFAFFSGVATFIESKYGTPTAWRLVYASFYFGFIQLLLGVNLACAIFRYKMYRKFPLLIFHISFLFILFGSGVTRYFGWEGSLHIRQGEQENIVKTSQSYVVLSDGDHRAYKQSYLSVIGLNDLDLSLESAGKTAALRYKSIITHAQKSYIKGAGKNDVIRFMLDDGAAKHEVDLSSKEYFVLDDIVISFAKELKMPLKTIFIADDYMLSANFDLKYLDISDNQTKTLPKDSKINLSTQNIIISVNDYKLRAYDIIQQAKFIYIPSDDERLANGLLFELEYDGASTDVYVLENSKPSTVKLAGKDFEISYGAVETRLPFSVYLDRFELLRYISSNSPKSYKSYITIKDGDKEPTSEIYMNNTLDYGGFRFFQSSYDTDEKGTILSVNKDPGKLPTYIGYFLLTLGLVLNLCDKNSRFVYLAKKLSTSASIVVIALLVMASSARADEAVLNDIKQTFKGYTAAKYENISAKEHFSHLARLSVQMPSSRIAPLDTLAKDLIEKITRRTSFDGMDGVEFLIKMMIDANEFKDKKLIYVGNEQIASKYSLQSAKYASFGEFFDDGGYRLRKEVEYANRKSPNKRNSYEKDLLKLDERINIVMGIYAGAYFRVFGYDASKPWLSLYDSATSGDKEYLQAYFLGLNYITTLEGAQKSGDYSLANNAVDLISYYQHQNISLDDAKVSAEIALNHSRIFTRLMQVYLVAGFVLLCVVFAQLVRSGVGRPGAFLARGVVIVLVLAFIAHTCGLLLRWYVSGHAPWSNSYESMVYISWAITLSGIIFARKSKVALSLGSILSGIMLFGAVLAELDPQITNLVPVLQSYWLSIHVSVITASYGFFGLCALLGCFVLVLMCLPSGDEARMRRVRASIKQATYINEMSMILGLSLLVIGNFFGAIWANESWGRYWGWDSKETWALVSILVYSFIVHTRLIKSLANTYIFAVLSMFAYWSIIMTYFGVNYFLTGMHSYAKGDLASVPIFVWLVFIFMIMLSLLAYKNKILKERL